ncbi:hypothetical protein ACJJH9_06855 [Microbulbifer sp. DLAB2-AF]|uniref:hypothetical protein n=1 Tax=Microbulbifer sp. DLAB2-AF TaxID=3243395 RepID=UPI00403A67D1
MKAISAEEYKLLGLFEREPERQGLDDLWLFDDSVYTATQENLKLTVAIHPYHKDVRIILWLGDREVYEYSAIDVQDIKVHKDSFRIDINPNQAININIRPSIGIKHEATKT